MMHAVARTSRFRRLAVAGAIAAATLLLAGAAAQAAPQALGLVATAQPVPMLCDAEGCAAQLSSFCLQRDRKSPTYGVGYHVAGGAGLRLHLTGGDGRRRTVAADGLLTLVSARGNTAVEARLRRGALAALGAVAVAVEVGPLVTLLPDPVPGDPEPITPVEAAFAAGPARLLAAEYFDSAAALGESLNILDRAINAVDRRARLDAAARRALWREVAGMPPERAGTGPAAPAARMFTTCLKDLGQGLVFGLRNCLEGRRDELLIEANTRLWQALETGT